MQREHHHPSVVDKTMKLDARIARWLAPDPKVQKYPNWTPYNYGLANPIRNVDPNGEEVRAYTERLGLRLFSQNAVGMSRDLPAKFRMGLLVGGAVAWETFGPRHSFLRISTPSSDQTLELGGLKVFLPMNAVGTGASATAEYRQIFERILKEENMKDPSVKSDGIATEKNQ
jgi:hypothetical protein